MTIQDVERWAGELEGQPPLAVLRWAVERFGRRVTMATGFGPEGGVLIDLVGVHALPIDIFTVDTGLLFPETYELWRRLEARYDLRIRAVRPRLSVEAQAEAWGPRLWERLPSQCCGLRKMEPLTRALEGYDAWITAIRRDQTAERATARIVEWEPRHGVVKINPLAGWTSADVWSYLRANDVPYNALHDLGYPSIGCRPCTTPVLVGEPERAGRWRGQTKTECGLHVGSRRAPPRHELLPLFLKLTGRRVLVVGGGPVAAAKTQPLIEAGAKVTVVAPEVQPALEAAPVVWHQRRFEPADLDGVWLVVAAATPEVNRQVAAAAEARRVFVNAVDDPANASAYAAGVLRRAGVTVAVSTGGDAPALAGLLREGLDALIPHDLDEWVKAARDLRPEWRRAGVPMAARRSLLLEALYRLYEERAERAAG
jgi:phosphoadenylyl-sulfate reductase (thioredoxin)